jgi:hypothetical protein
LPPDLSDRCVLYLIAYISSSRDRDDDIGIRYDTDAPLDLESQGKVAIFEVRDFRRQFNRETLSSIFSRLGTTWRKPSSGRSVEPSGSEA